jgi:hypothetical protein
VLTISIVTSRAFTKNTLAFTARLDAVGKKNAERIETIIEKELTPSIHLHNGPEEVAVRSDQIIREVADDPIIADRQITFYGAASLAAMPDPESAETAETEPAVESKAPSDIYWEAIKHAGKNQVRMRRYISLFKDPEIQDRRKEIQSQYLNWLKRQYQLLKDDENYQLIDVVRAPQWGANMARTLTKTTVMDITGNGRAAIVITDKQIAQRIREYAREAVTSKKPRNPAVSYGLTADDPANLEKFKSYINRIANICQLPGISDNDAKAS